VSRRVVTQIASLAGFADRGPKVVALCNDGTLWAFGHGTPWARCSPVPQGDDPRDPIPPFYCDDCVHRKPSNGAEGPQCERPRDVVHDLVTGRPVGGIALCHEERQDVPGRCGRDAQYFLLNTKKDPKA
jgi:hypothetical protein